MRELEQIAINDIGIPSILLMENAALCTAKHCLKVLENKKNPGVMIFCGNGNNGGDGMAIARHLFVKGVDTKIVFAGDINAVKGDPAVYLNIIRKLGIPVELSLPDSVAVSSCDLIVDAMFGTGLDRNVEGQFEAVIKIVNKYARHIISVDMPSGVHSGTGRIMGCAVNAAKTVTFGYLKTGICVNPGALYAGRVYLEDISLPENLIEKIEVNASILTDREAGLMLPVRSERSNKGSYGKVLVFAGSCEMPGAAALVSSASYAVGCGLVCACVLDSVANVIHNWQMEVVTRILPGENGLYCKKSVEAIAGEINRSSVIVLGPGIGRGSDVTEFVREILSIAEIPVVLDADALFAVCEDKNILKVLKAPCVITPHPGEMSRLTGLSISEILNDPVNAAVNFSRAFNVIALLKDSRTIIASPDGSFYINTTGNNALAKAGSGDVLAGMIAGLIAQGLDINTASVLGAYIHGKSGEAASVDMSNYSTAASDIIDYIPQVIKSITPTTWHPAFPV